MGYFIIGDLQSFDFLNLPNTDSSSLIYLVIPVFAYVLSNLLFKKQLKTINPRLPLEENFMLYQNAPIVRWAILEDTAFLILVFNKDFLIFGILIILLYPSEDKVKNDLNNFSS